MSSDVKDRKAGGANGIEAWCIEVLGCVVGCLVTGITTDQYTAAGGEVKLGSPYIIR